MTTRSEIQTLITANACAMDIIDDIVHEVASQMASATSNKGLNAQLEFLNAEGLDDEHVLQHLEEALEP